jgi:hypothetical protein
VTRVDVGDRGEWEELESADQVHKQSRKVKRTVEPSHQYRARRIRVHNTRSRSRKDTMKIKNLKVDGHDVEVSSEEIQHSGHSPAFRITAKVGDSVHVHHHTIGAESGEIADYTAESLQAEIDSASPACRRRPL